MLYSFLFICFCNFLQGQNLFIHAGPMVGHNSLNELSPDGFPHVGHRVGVDFSVNKGRLHILLGGHYLKYEFNPTIEKTGFKYDTPHREMKGRVGLGLNIVSIPKVFKLRIKAMGAIHYGDVDNEDIVIPYPYTAINKTYYGADFGLGINVSFVTLDLEYEKGLSNVIENTKESTFDFWSITAGVSF